MRFLGLDRRRSQNLMLLVGQLVLIAYVFQVAAFDHWAAPPIDASAFNVSGVEGTDAHARLHADHCHGAPSSCADAGGGFVHVSLSQAIELPAGRPSLVLPTELGSPEPVQAFIAILPEPPRAAS